MANFQYNVSKGRVVELYNRVVSNDPANSAIILVVLATSGLESDATLKDKDTLADVVSGTTNEVTNTNYARKVLTNTELSALTVDDTNDRIDLDFPDQTWTDVAAGDGWSKVVLNYDSDTTAGTDANIIPLLQYDFAVTPDGSSITLQVDPAGFFRAA
jgi:hypothetical protein